MVSNVLVEVLGGARAVAMTSCTFVIVDPYEVQMRGVCTTSGKQEVLVKYNPKTDLFDVKICKFNMRKLELVVCKEIEGIYVGQLRATVEQALGLSLVL